MKHLNLLLGAALAAFSFAACQPEENPADQPASITIDPENDVEFPAKGAESHFVDVVSTRDWKIDNVPDWMAVSKGGQSVKNTKIEASLNAVTIEISVQDNEDYDRSANITFNAGTKKKTITVTQKGEKAARDGSKNSPFTASQARTEALKLASGAVSDKEYYIEGIIHKIATPKDTDLNQDGTLKYGNISFYISDDGTSSKDNDFYCYRTYNLDGANFSKLDELKVGDAVVVCGKITNYQGTPETNGADKPYLYSLNGKTGGNDGPAEELTIDQIIEKKTGNVKTTGKIMHVGKSGVILNDGTDNNLYVYTTTTFKKGDVVEVEGTAKEYGGLVEVEKATYTASTKTINAKEKSARTLTLTEMESYSVKSSELVSFAGTLKKSGNYVNIVLDGTTSIQGSYNSAEDVSAFDSRKVTVTGYYGGKSTSGGTTYFNVIGTGVVGDDSDYFSVSTESINVSATDTKASFDITTNLAWTVSSDNANFTVKSDSGTGNATVEVSFPANTDEKNSKTANITVTTTLGTKTVTITQNKSLGDGLTSITLTNEEIVAGIKGGTSYGDFTISSAGGDWKVNAYGGQKFLQFRATKGSYVKSPTFAGNVAKIEVNVDASKKQTAPRVLYVIPSSTQIPNSESKYKDLPDVIKNAYGTIEFGTQAGTGEVQTIGDTASLEISSDIKDFILVSADGAIYVHSITVYTK